MIKFETIGMIDAVVLDPTLVSDADIPNYSFKKFNDADYLIGNTLTGDNAYCTDAVLPAGTMLNGWRIESLKGMKLVVDAKHIDGDIKEVAVGDVLKPTEDGKLSKSGTAASDFAYKVTELTYLTEKAVKVEVADAE